MWPPSRWRGSSDALLMLYSHDSCKKHMHSHALGSVSALINLMWIVYLHLSSGHTDVSQSMVVVCHWQWPYNTKTQVTDTIHKHMILFCILKTSQDAWEKQSPDFNFTPLCKQCEKCRPVRQNHICVSRRIHFNPLTSADAGIMYLSF